MNIDKLPVDCLIHIFNHFNKFEDLLNYSEVCQSCKDAVLARLRYVKYLADDREIRGYPTGNVTIFANKEQLEGIELSVWFPNLKILDVHEDLDVNIVSNLRVRGLILKSYADLEILDNTFNNPSLSMLQVSRFCDFFTNDTQGPMIKQLCITECDDSDFASHANNFPNLERLHIEEYIDRPYTGPIFEKIQILEVRYSNDLKPCVNYGLRLADHCPGLKSAYHYIEKYQRLECNNEIKNHCLEDLVLAFEEFHIWSVLRSILSKYPNLKHLAIRGPTAISDENIPDLLELLPHLVLIDFRDSEKVTEKSKEYIDRYCEHHNRSISFFYKTTNETDIKWPHFSEEKVFIGREFDFMKYCFFKPYYNLPFLLDQNE